MAAPRRVIEVAISEEEGSELERLARSRNGAGKPGRAGAHAARLSGDALVLRGVTHQTVERCLRRAERLGVLATLDDSPRPGREPVITDEARTFIVDLACRKAKDLGYPHELWTTRLAGRTSNRTRCATISSAATRSSTPRWPRSCVSVRAPASARDARRHRARRMAAPRAWRRSWIGLAFDHSPPLPCSPTARRSRCKGARNAREPATDPCGRGLR
jgi:hypothetical protein